MKKPSCRKCIHKRNIPGDAHIKCNNINAVVKGNEHGKRNGWFLWPMNFDPVWLISCDGFSDNPKDNLKTQKTDPIFEILSMLK